MRFIRQVPAYRACQAANAFNAFFLHIDLQLLQDAKRGLKLHKVGAAYLHCGCPGQEVLQGVLGGEDASDADDRNIDGLGGAIDKSEIDRA